MRLLRCALTAALAGAIALVVLTGSGSAASTTPSPPAPPRAQLARFSCVHGLDPIARTVSIQSVMRPLPGTRKLAVRFDLLQRLPGAPAWTVVQVGDLGTWRTPSDPTLGRLPGDVWRLGKTVIDLDAPAAYQFRVTFRWTGAHNQVLGTAVRRSRTCRERELRPDLLVQSITISPIAGHPDQRLYTAVIADQGATGAGPFQVLFAPGNAMPPTIRTVTFLRAGQSRQESFVGPVCDAANPPTVTADSTAQVDDYDRSNNQLAATCPAASGTAAVGTARR